MIQRTSHRTIMRISQPTLHTNPSTPSTGSFINCRNSAWCSWINLRRWGFCLASSCSIGCNKNINSESQFCNQKHKVDTYIREGQTCKICGLACTIARNAWNWRYKKKSTCEQSQTLLQKININLEFRVVCGHWE